MKHPLSDGRCVGVGEPRRTGHLPGRNRPEAPEVRAPERPGAQLPQAGAVGGAQGPKARASRTRTSGVRSLGGISKSTSRGRSYRSPLWGAGAPLHSLGWNPTTENPRNTNFPSGILLPHLPLVPTLQRQKQNRNSAATCLLCAKKTTPQLTPHTCRRAQSCPHTRQ